MYLMLYFEFVKLYPDVTHVHLVCLSYGLHTLTLDNQGDTLCWSHFNTIIYAGSLHFKYISSAGIDDHMCITYPQCTGTGKGHFVHQHKMLLAVLGNDITWCSN